MTLSNTEVALSQALRDDEAARLAALEIESCIVEAPAGAGGDIPAH